MTTNDDGFVEEIGVDGKTIVRRERALLPGHQTEDGCPACPACGCPDLDGTGRRRNCNHCGKVVFIYKEHQGPKCEHCGEPLEVTHTGAWKDGKRERRYRCRSTKCHLPKTLIEFDPDWKAVQNAN